MGSWAITSHGNDSVHDLLITAGRKQKEGCFGFSNPGTLTNTQLEQFLMNKFINPLQLSDDEKCVQAALGTLCKLEELIYPTHFIGLVIWGLDRGWTFNKDILNVANDAGMELLYNQNKWPQYINQWRNPKLRHYQFLKEICRIKQAIKEKNDV